MFIGKSYEFLRKRLTQRLLVPLAGAMVFCQNPAVHAGIVVNDNTTTNVTIEPLRLNFTNGTHDTSDGNTDNNPTGAVIIIENSATDLTIDVVNKYIDAGFESTADIVDIDQNLIDQFYQDPANHSFTENDNIAILNSTNFNTTIIHDSPNGNVDGIRGHIVLFGGDNVINMTGSVGDIIGNLYTGDGNDSVLISGISWLHGKISTGGGDDNVEVSSSAYIDNDADLGEGNNSITLSQNAYISGQVDAGSGVDIITLSDNSYITGTVNTGAGNDEIIVSGQIENLNAAAYISGDVNLGDGDDKLTVSLESTISGTISGGAGIDTVNLEDTASITLGGSINLDSGNDILNADSETTISGNVNLGSDNDLANIDGASIEGSVFTGDGDDLVLITNGATISGDITGSSTDGTGTNFSLKDDDGFEIASYSATGDRVIVENGSTIEGSISLLDGQNTVDVTESTVSGSISFGGLAGELQTLNFTDSTFSGNLILNGAGTANINLNGTTVELGQDINLSTSTGINTINVNNGSVIQTGDYNIALGAGDDSININDGGSITSALAEEPAEGEEAEENPALSIVTGDGNDTITINSGGTLAPDKVAVDFGSGVNTFAFEGNATYTGELSLYGSGTTQISFNGSGEKINGTLILQGTDNKVIYNELTTTQSSLAPVWGNVRGLTIIGGSEVTETVSLAVGANQEIILSDKATLSSDLNFSTGNDTLSLAGSSTLNGNVDFSTGNTSSTTLSDSVLNGSISANNTTSDNISLTNSTVNGNITLANSSAKTISSTNSTIAGNIVTSGAGNASLTASNATFSGSVNMDGNSGIDAISLADSTIAGTLNLGSGDGSVSLTNSTITGNSDAGAGTDSLTLDGTGAINSSFTNYDSLTKNGTGTWDINQDLSVSGDTNINGGIVNLNAMLTTSSVYINNGSTLNLNDNDIITTSPTTLVINSTSSLYGSGNITGNVVVDSEAKIAGVEIDDSINIDGNLTFNDSSNLTTVVGLSSNSSLNVTGALTATNTNLTIDLKSLKEDGDLITIATAGSGIDGSQFNSLSDTYIYTYDLVSNSDSSNLIATVGREQYTELDSAVIQELAPVAEELEVVRAASLDSTELLQLETQGQSDFEDSFKDINPSALTHLSNIAINSHNNFVNQISDRMDSLQFGLKSFTLAGPSGPEGQVEELDNIWNMWVDTNYKTGELDSDGSTHGYEFDSYNFSIGGDISVNADWMIGSAFSYGQADVEYDNNSGDSDVDSYSVAGYAKFTQNQFFWDSILSLSMGEADTERNVNGTSSDIESDADSMIYSLSTQVGYQIESDNTFFTPIAGLSYSQSSIDGVDEKGSVFAVETDDQDYDSLLSKIGFRTGFMSIMDDEDFYTLELKAYWYHEFMDTDRDIDARFVSGGNAFNVDGIENEEDSFVLGLGWRYEFNDSEIVVDYDYEMSSDYESHNIGLAWVIRF